MNTCNLAEALYEGRDPDAPAFFLPSGETVTYGRMSSNVRSIASALRGLGLNAGDRVSVLLPKSLEVVALTHACFQLGCIVHPLNTGYTDDEVSYLVADVKPRLFICEPEAASKYQTLLASSSHATTVLTFAEGGRGMLGALFGSTHSSEPVALVSDDTPAALLYTSGTTGKPKGALITHGNLRKSAQALAQVWGITERDRLMHALPVYHAHGLLTSINAVLMGGGSIELLTKFDADEMLGRLAVCTMMMGVPTHYARLLKEPGLVGALSADFRLAISGSAPLPASLSDAFRGVTGITLLERYGATETAIVCAIPAGQTGHDGWVGWPLPGIEVRVKREDGKYSGTSAMGDLETRGHNIFAGYWGNEAASREAFVDGGWFITGDIAEISETGCVRIVGRSKDLIITGGLNVYPKEIEQALESLPGIQASAVFGVPHEDFGEAVVAAIEADSSVYAGESTAITELKKQLASYKVPKRIIEIDAIPVNNLGKVQKSSLREQYEALFNSTSKPNH